MKNIAYFLLCSLFTMSVFAQNPAPEAPIADSVMVTVFLKHQQDKNLAEIGDILEKNKFWEQFPPKSAKVISWYVMMGIGQVVTVKIPGGGLREFNLSIEKGAWGAFDTEFYPTYDLYPVIKGKLTNRK